MHINNLPQITKADLIKQDAAVFEIPQSFSPVMRVPARVFVTESLLDDILTDRSLNQIVNVAALPGIVGYAYAMPDIHQGYGFPIGGVAATSYDAGGVVSPGGIGYDINCGVRLLRTGLTAKIFEKKREQIADMLAQAVPSGVGRGGRHVFTPTEFDELLAKGATTLIERGIGTEADRLACEEEGFLQGADPAAVSEKAKLRGFEQIGTLGAGNHFLEVQKITKIFDEEVARHFGLEQDMITVMIHCGSRGLGHQVCTDAVQVMVNNLAKWDISLPDRELACAPLTSAEGQEYIAGMNAAAHFAWANRHAITHAVRTVFQSVYGTELDVTTVYDVCHNIGKREKHLFEGAMRELFVHRKGATRAFGAGNPTLSPFFQKYGHPVLIPGTMGTSSYVMVGAPYEAEQAWGSACHGAGRTMSRTAARGYIKGQKVKDQLEKQGISIRCRSFAELAEEAPHAYKSISSVIDAVSRAHLARPIAKLEPLAVIKG